MHFVSWFWVRHQHWSTKPLRLPNHLICAVWFWHVASFSFSEIKGCRHPRLSWSIALKNHATMKPNLIYSIDIFALIIRRPSSSLVSPLKRFPILQWPNAIFCAFVSESFNSIKWSYLLVKYVYRISWIEYLVTFVIKSMVLLTDCRDQTEPGYSLSQP